MIILEVIAAILGFVAMMSATALGVHVLLEDSEILGHLKNKLKAPDEAELVKRNALKLEAEVEAEEKKRRQMEYWGLRLDNAHEKRERLEAGKDNRFADGARYEFEYPDDKIGTEMRKARETSREFGGEPDQKERVERLEKYADETFPAINAAREFGETADELGERVERAIHERIQKYKAEIKKRERTKQRTEKYDKKRMEQQRKRIPLEMVYQYHNTPPHRRPPGGMSELARIHDLARRTIDNEFGIGQERMQRLGPDYRPVQAEVNRILKKATQKTNRRP